MCPKSPQNNKCRQYAVIKFKIYVISSSHQNVTCSHHYIAEKLLPIPFWLHAMVSVLVSSVVDHGFKPQLGQTNDL